MIKKSIDDYGRLVISILVTLIFAAWVYLCWRKLLPDSPLTNNLNGTITAAFLAIVYFFVGSSAGSKAKDTAKDAVIINGQNQLANSVPITAAVRNPSLVNQAQG